MVEFDPKSISFNPEVLKSLRDRYLANQSQLAKAAGISIAQLVRFEEGKAAPSSAVISRLAKYFRVPDQTFYRITPPRQTKTIDFRRNLRGFHGDPGPIIDAITHATQVQKLISSVVDASETWRGHNFDRVSTNQNAEEIALLWRSTLGISSRYQASRASNSQFFTYVRSKIESLGVSVLVSSIEEKFVKGLTIGTNDDVPIIVINSYMQQRSSRTFTLAHEFGHVLIGSDDVSNPYAPDGTVERFCNKFAGAFLIPKGMLADFIRLRRDLPSSNSSIRWLANKFKVSMEAIVIRLHECGITAATFWAEWKSQFSADGRLPSEEEEGGGGGVSQGIVKLAGLGFLFGSTVPVRYRERGLTPMAVFKASRLKPRYFSDLHEATSARLKEVESYGAA